MLIRRWRRVEMCRGIHLRYQPTLLAVAAIVTGYGGLCLASAAPLTSKARASYNGTGDGNLEIFCYPARPYTPFGVFASSRLEFRMLPNSYDLYEGETELDVKQLYGNGSRSWFPVLLQRTYVPFPSFTDKCIGIVSRYPYNFVFREYNIDYFRLLQCGASLSLFFYARRLVHSPAIFYSSGALVGVIASILILAVLLKRILPGGRMALTAMFVTGWSFWIYLLLQLWNRKLELFSDYKNYFLAYVGISAGIAFLICYRWGPPKEERTIDTMQIIMQFFALTGVYFSSDIPEVTLAICVVAIMAYNFPAKLSARMKTWLKRRFFKPKIYLLSEEEYIRQGDETTALELEKLRNFARSPDCNAWKLMSRLKDPSRFGSFVMGESHLEDSEILEYETGGPLFDDEASLTHDESEDDDRGDFSRTPERRPLAGDASRGGIRWPLSEGSSSSEVSANGNLAGNHPRSNHNHPHRT